MATTRKTTKRRTTVKGPAGHGSFIVKTKAEPQDAVTEKKHYLCTQKG